MKKQLVKDLKERFQLPGKIGLTLENLFGEKEKFLREAKNLVEVIAEIEDFLQSKRQKIRTNSETT